MDMKKGTTTIGIVCKDGIVLAADKRATAGTLIVDKTAEKVHQINENSAVTIAGTVSDAQLIIKLIKAEVRLKAIRSERDVSMKETANLLGGILYQSIRQMSMIPAVAHFLLGGKDSQGFHLYDLFPDGSVTLVKDYVSSGSGSVIAYGVLETKWKPDLSVEEGIKIATQGIYSALQRDAATGNGIDIVTVTDKGIKRVVENELRQEFQPRK